MTILTGYMRMSPRSEVADHVVSGLQVIIAKGGGAVGNTGWAVLIVERSPDGAIFDLSHRGVEAARCFFAITPASERRLWEEASAYRTLLGVRPAKPTAPWFAVGLLPDGRALLGNQPDLMLELGDFAVEGQLRASIADRAAGCRDLEAAWRLFGAERTVPFRPPCRANIHRHYVPRLDDLRERPAAIPGWGFRISAGFRGIRKSRRVAGPLGDRCRRPVTLCWRWPTRPKRSVEMG